MESPSHQPPLLFNVMCGVNLQLLISVYNKEESGKYEFKNGQWRNMVKKRSTLTKNKETLISTLLLLILILLKPMIKESEKISLDVPVLYEYIYWQLSITTILHDVKWLQTITTMPIFVS